jgi:hypothetical protein
MSETQRNEVKARLMAACNTDATTATWVRRQRLIDVSRRALTEPLARVPR